ncbi:hypothetical protein [Calothrix sp. PCC 6303]|nr:hypothetical protein [Calothrix sp. PCC 6303]
MRSPYIAICIKLRIHRLLCERAIALRRASFAWHRFLNQITNLSTAI